jgi:hypothetical protein
MRGNGRKPQHVPAAPAVESTADSAGELDDVLTPSASRITSPLGFPLLPVVIGYGFLFFVAVAMLASMATFHEEQVMVVGGKFYLGAVGLAILFTLGGWVAEVASQQVKPNLPDDPAGSADAPSS